MKYLPISLAVALHLVILFKFTSNEVPAVNLTQPVPKLVNAVAVDTREVQAEVSRLKNQRAATLKAERLRQARAKAQLEKLKKQRQFEQAKLSKLKKYQRETELAAAARAEEITLTAEQEQILRYKILITQALSQHWIKPQALEPKQTSQFQLVLDTSGKVLSVKLTKSSGNKALDRSARNAIFKASPLPVPKDRELLAQFRQINLTVRPEGFTTKG